MIKDEQLREGLTEAHFVLEGSIPSDEITDRLGTKPTSSRRFRNPLKGVEVTEWSLSLAEAPRAFEVIAEAEKALLARGDDWAREIGDIVQAPYSSAALVIVQRISDDPDTKGLVLSRDLVRWLAMAHSFIAVDQYLEG